MKMKGMITMMMITKRTMVREIRRMSVSTSFRPVTGGDGGFYGEIA
jgi:hypothetical protein